MLLNKLIVEFKDTEQYRRSAFIPDLLEFPEVCKEGESLT